MLRCGRVCGGEEGCVGVRKDVEVRNDLWR